MKDVIIYDFARKSDARSQSSIVNYLQNITCVDFKKFIQWSNTKRNKYFYLNLMDDGTTFCQNEEFVPGFLEIQKNKYVGSSASSISISSNKIAHKLILKSNKFINIPKFVICEPEFIMWDLLKKIDFFPVIIKPFYTTGSIGINKDSVKSSMKELKSAVSNLKTPFIIEEYIDGIECTVSGIGNEENLMLFPVKWFKSDEKKPVLTYSAKWENESTEYHSFKREYLPPDRTIKKIMKDIQRELSIHDYIKADFIKSGDKYFLIDLSPNPTITLESDFYKQFCESNLCNLLTTNARMEHLLYRILDISKKRQIL